MGFNTLTADPFYDFSGTCDANSTAYFLIRTSEGEFRENFNQNSIIATEIFGGDANLGVITSSLEFNISSQLSGYLELDSFWLGIELKNGEINNGILAEANIEQPLNIEVDDLIFFENLAEFPWIESLEIPNTNNRFVAFQNSFFNGQSNGEIGWNIFEFNSRAIEGFLYKELNSSLCYDKNEEQFIIRNDLDTTDQMTIVSFESESVQNKSFDSAVELCQSKNLVLTTPKDEGELNLLLNNLLFEINSFELDKVSIYWLGVVVRLDADGNIMFEFNDAEAFEDLSSFLDVSQDDFVENEVEFLGVVAKRVNGKSFLDLHIVDFIDDDFGINGAICRESDAAFTPTASPTVNPTLSPTTSTINSTQSPTTSPTVNPTQPPTTSPTINPSQSPSTSPTVNPTQSPTTSPTVNPTQSPTTSPTINPTISPTTSPTNNPTQSPINSPTVSSDVSSTFSPNLSPTTSPTIKPIVVPTTAPTSSSVAPSPTGSPTLSPTLISLVPTLSPTITPTDLPPSGEENEGVLSENTLFMSIIAFMGLVLIVLVILLRKKNKKDYRLEELPAREPTYLINTKPEYSVGGYISAMNDDKFSVISGITELQRKRSFGTESIASFESRRTEITAVDRNNDKMVKSVISNRSEFSAMSKKLLNVSPFVENIRNNSELLCFYQKVDDYLTAQIEKDAERIETDETFIEFNAIEVPNISINIYARRLVNGLNMWFNEVAVEDDDFLGMRALLLALHLIKKLNEEHPLTNYNIHRILSTTMLVAVKFIEDEVITNEFWADMAGIATNEVTSLEQIFCFSLDFNFNIEQADILQSLDTFRI